MRKLAATAVAAAAFGLPAAGVAGPQPVLGIDATPVAPRLAWFDPATLAVLRGRKVPLGGHTGEWAFAADRSLLAVAAPGYPGIRFVDPRGMRRLGDLTLTHGAEAAVAGLAWARRDRLLVAVSQAEGGFVAVVDPQRRRTVRRVELPSIHAAAALPGGMALLLGAETGLGPVRVAVVAADGTVRTAAVDRFAVGTVFSSQGEDLSVETKVPGFAVDPSGRRAFVVGPDFTVADVDLDTLDVAYHPRAARSLAKRVGGSVRSAGWLGNGLLAVAGVDYLGGDDARAAGLSLVDTRDWRVTSVDPGAGSFGAAGGVLVSGGDVYGLDGALRYSIDLGSEERLSVQGAYGYVCDTRAGVLQRVVRLSTGATVRRLSGGAAPRCPVLLYGQSSG
jgi:hypothetical protein